MASECMLEEPHSGSFGLEELYKAHTDYSWCEQLQPDPETEKYGMCCEASVVTRTLAPNKSARQVTAGHYVPVLPTPLPEPTLIACSKAMLEELGLTEKDTKDPRFAAFFGGDLSVLGTSESLL